MVLIFSIENDLSTSSVIKWLQYYQQKVIVISSDDNIYKFVKANSESLLFKNTLTGTQYNLLEFDACWWRRTGLSMKNFTKNELNKRLVVDGDDISDIVNGSKSILNNEINDLRYYIFSRIYKNCKIKIGNPNFYALNRLFTMEIASQKGFVVPDFEIISNTKQISDSDVIKDKFVSKAISNGIYNNIGQKRYYSYTELHRKDEYYDSSLNIFPSLITSLINKKYEIRTFYLDGHFFSMAIFSQTNSQTKVDFRKYSTTKPNRTEPYQLPAEIELKLKAVFDEFQLNCGSADLIVDDNNNFVFLEINPVGQYYMTSEPCNYHLDKIIAKYLIYGNVCKE